MPRSDGSHEPGEALKLLRHTLPPSTRRKYRITERYDICEFTRGVLKLTLWPWQEVALRVLYGLPFTCDEHHDVFARLTSDVYGKPQSYTPGTELPELVAAVGRRSGKTKGIIAPVVIYESLRDWTEYLGSDEGHCYAILVSSSLSQSMRLIQQSVADLIFSIPELAAEVETYDRRQPTAGTRQTTSVEQLVLKNRNVIMSLACTSTAGRGYPTYLLALDELAHFYKIDGSTRQDKAVLNALEPGMLQFKGRAKLLMLSSPADKRGVLYDAVKTADLERDARFVVKAATSVCRPDADEPAMRKYLERRERRDPVSFAVEYGAEFADSISGLLDRESIDACVGSYVRRHRVDGIDYEAAMDPSQGGDSWGLAVGHWNDDDKTVVIDCAMSLTRKGRKVDLESVVRTIRAVLAAYGLTSILSDQFEAESLAALLARDGVHLHRQDWSLKTRRAHGARIKAIIDQRRLLLPDVPELRDDLLSLQRVYLDSGAWTIKARRIGGRHGDLADCVQCLGYRLDRGGDDGRVVAGIALDGSGLPNLPSQDPDAENYDPALDDRLWQPADGQTAQAFAERFGYLP